MLKKIYYLSNLIVIIFGVSFAFATQVRVGTLDPYAYGMKIDIPKGQPVSRFAMPKEVYQHVQHANLSDVAIFDKSNEPVPFQIITSNSETDVIRKQVDFYPIFTESDALPKLSVSMLNNDGKTNVNISTDSGSNTTKIIDYIIPLADLKDDNLKELELNWKKTRKNWVAEISLWVSDDLKNWQHISQKNMSIANLDFAGKALLRNIVPIGFTLKNQYLLVRWMGQTREINLEHVYAITSHTKAASNVYTQTLEHRKLLEKNAFEYRLEGYYPVSQVNLTFAEPNRLSNAVIFSKSARKASNWQYRGSGFFYLLEKDGKILKNQPIAIARDTDKLWKVAISDRTKAAKPYPSLKVYWVPDNVVFVAQGEGPYTLAFGSATSTGSQDIAAIQKILKQYNGKLMAIPQVKTRTFYTISGEEAFKTQIAWREVMLWAILILGAVLVLWMLFVLRREIKSSKK